MNSPSNEQSNKYPLQNINKNYTHANTGTQGLNINHSIQREETKSQVTNSNRPSLNSQKQSIPQNTKQQQILGEKKQTQLISNSNTTILTTASIRQTNPINSNQTLNSTINQTRKLDATNKLSILSPRAQFISGLNQNQPQTQQNNPSNLLNPEGKTLNSGNPATKGFNFNFGKSSQQNPQIQQQKTASQSNSIVTQSTKNSSNIQSILQNAQQSNNKTSQGNNASSSQLGYKSFIQAANKKDSRTTNTSPVMVKNTNLVQSNLIIQKNTNQTAGSSQQFNQKDTSQNQNVIRSSNMLPSNDVQQQNISQMPTANISISQSQKVSPVRNMSPGSDKIVIKKSEIKFKTSNTSLGSQGDTTNKSIGQNIVIHSQKANDATTISNQKEELNNERGTTSDILSQGKQLAFDFIKSIIGVGTSTTNSNVVQNQQVNQFSTSPSNDYGVNQSPTILNSVGGILKKKFQKFGSPGFNHNKTLKKQNVNFVHDMKKHGIQKDIDSVKALSLIDTSQQQNNHYGSGDLLSKYGMDGQTQKDLAIDVINKPNEKTLKDIQKVSPSNENNYIFPFQRRARSLSPPKDGNLGDNSQNSQGSLNMDSPHNSNGGGIVTSFKFPNDSAINKIIHNKNGHQFNGLANNKYGMNNNNNSSKHNRVNSGPIIPDRNCIEKVIKHTPGIFFGMGMGPHLKQYDNLRQEQQYFEMEENILKGKEVDDWADGGLVDGLTENNNLDDKLYTTDNNKLGTTSQRQSVFNQIGNSTLTGFLGDEDEVEDEEINILNNGNQGMIDNDDWMYQTFEKQNRQKAKTNASNKQQVKQPQMIQLNADKIIANKNQSIAPTFKNNHNQFIQYDGEEDCEFLDLNDDDKDLLNGKSPSYMNYFKDEMNNFSPSNLDRQSPFSKQSGNFVNFGINLKTPINDFDQNMTSPPSSDNNHAFKFNNFMNSNNNNGMNDNQFEDMGSNTNINNNHTITNKNSAIQQQQQQQQNYSSMLDKWLNKTNNQ
eukprot:403331980